MCKQDFGAYKIVAVELCTGGAEHPDVWGTTGYKSMLIEVKTSHSDFLRDMKKPIRMDSNVRYRKYRLGNNRYYLAPKGLVGIDELPPHWGLLEWNGTSITKVKEAEYVVCENIGELGMLCSIMRREGVRKGIFNYREKKQT